MDSQQGTTMTRFFTDSRRIIRDTIESKTSDNGCHSPPSDNGCPNGRDARGRFTTGNRLGLGSSFARRAGELRRLIQECVAEDDLRLIIYALVGRAKDGDLAAAKLILAYTVGKPQPAPDPDRVTLDEATLLKQQGDAGIALSLAIDPRHISDVLGATIYHYNDDLAENIRRRAERGEDDDEDDAFAQPEEPEAPPPAPAAEAAPAARPRPRGPDTFRLIESVRRLLAALPEAERQRFAEAVEPAVPAPPSANAVVTVSPAEKPPR